MSQITFYDRREVDLVTYLTTDSSYVAIAIMTSPENNLSTNTENGGLVNLGFLLPWPLLWTRDPRTSRCP